ncbi:MAG: T9SS type A sorting domain-containing protein [Bacteroidales bacterium]|nr:T9SS type A sorting domain-containing protein [Bacteroidales bacterium]
MRRILSIFLVLLPLLSVAQFAPPAGQEGTTAMNADSSAFVAWATGCVVERGPKRIDRPEQGVASYGVEADALGKANDTLLVSLGDGGNAVLTFASPICNGPGPDFAVFENPLESAQHPGTYFLELAFVEVSSDGEHFVRFPAYSNIPYETQMGSFGCTDPSLVHNLAGKYAPHYGTPFDLDDLEDEAGLDKQSITHVRVVDVVGCIRPEYATYDVQGHIVNDPWPTPFESSGFDLDAVGVIHDVAHYQVGEWPESAVRVIPNPVADQLHVEAEHFLSLAVYSVAGQQLLVSESSHVDVSFLPDGLYLLRVVDGDRTVVKKIIKTKL